MTEHQESPERADLRIVEGVSPARLHGEACIHCGSTQPPLCPDRRVQTRVSEGVLKTWDVVTCLPCKGGPTALSPRDRYRVEQRPAEGQRPGLWAIRDQQTGGLVLDSDGALELFAMEDSARAWIRREHGLGQSVMTGVRR